MGKGINKLLFLIILCLFLLPFVNGGIVELDNLEHDITDNSYNSLIQIDSSHYILAYSGVGTDGFITTFSIDGSYTITELNTLEHDTLNGIYNSLVKIDNTHFILAYAGDGIDGFISTFSIDGSYVITELNTLEHDTLVGISNSLVMIDSTHFILLYYGGAGVATITTFSIDGSYAITELNSLQFDISPCEYGSLVMIDSTHFISACQLNSDGFITTFSIDGSYAITELNTLQHDLSDSLEYNSLVKIDNTHFILAYAGLNNDGYIKTFSIDGSYVISQINSLEHDTADGAHNSLIKIDDTHFILGYTTTGADGQISTFSIDGSYVITELNTLEHDIADTTYNSLMMINPSHFLLAYQGISGDGYIKSFFLNTIPTTPTALSLTNPVYVGSTLTATGSGSTDSDNDTVTYHYEFYNTNDATIVQAFSSDNTYVLQTTDAHNTIRVRTKAWDGSEYSSSYYEATRSVSNTIPTTPTALSLTNPVYVSSTLTATGSGSTDVDGDTITYHYEFYNTNDATIVQAFSSDNTYVLQTTDAHNTIRVRTKAWDGSEYSSSYYEATRSVSNTIPTTPSALSLTNPVYVGSTLTATGSGSTDADGDTVTYHYEFYNINSSTTLQAYSSDNTYVLQQSDAHDLIRVRTKAWDGFEYSSSYYEATRSVSNTLPTSPSGINYNSPIYVNSQLNATAVGCTDIDGDTIYKYYEFENYNSSTIVQSLSLNFTYVVQSSDAHDRINIYAWCYDNYGYDTGAMVYVSVSNSLPSIPSAIDITNPIYVSTNMLMNATGSIDIDNDAIVYYYEVYNINDSSLKKTYGTLDEYLIPANCAHDTLRIRAWAFDGISNSSSYIEENITVSNSLPTVPTIISLTSPVYQGYILEANVSGSSDSDNDGITYYYEFYNSNSSTILQNYSLDNTYLTQASDLLDFIRVRGKSFDSYSFSLNYIEDSEQVMYAPCAENWLPYYGSCNTNDQQIKYYLDNNSCVPSENLPIDNGTFVACNYCSEDLTLLYTGCLWNGSNFFITAYYEDNNYYSCCDITNIASDCSIEYEPYNLTELTACNAQVEDFEIQFDQDALYGFSSRDKVYWKFWINNTNMTEDYDCISYIKTFDDGVVGETVQVNPVYTKKQETLLATSTGYDDREYFSSVNGLGNVYFTRENLIVDGRQYLFGVQCTGNNEKLNSEYVVTVGYEALSSPFTLTFWANNNKIGLFLFIIGFLFITAIIGTLFMAYKRYSR